MEVGLNQVHEIRDHQGGIKELGVHPDNDLFFARSDDMLVVYSLKGKSKIQGFYDSAGYDAAMFEPAGNMLVYMSDEKLHYWNPVEFRERIVVPGEILEIRDRDIHPGARLVADGENDGSILITQVGSDSYDEPLMVLKGHKNYIEYVRFHPNGKVLASGSADMTLRFWDLESGNQIGEFKAHDDFVTSIEFTKDGSKVITGDYSGVIKVWDFRIG